jgi:hypothetical protein
MPAQKRKSDAGQPSSSKKSRASHSSAKALVKAILADRDSYPIPDSDEDIRQSLVELAEYVTELEQDIKQLEAGAGSAQALTADQLDAAIEKIRKAAHSGIKKQMTVGFSHPSDLRRPVLTGDYSGSRLARLALPSGATTAFAPIPSCSVPCSASAVHRSGRCTKCLLKTLKNVLVISMRLLGLVFFLVKCDSFLLWK